SFLLSTCRDESLSSRLTKLTEGFATVRAAQCNGSEFVLASAWQLALALGAHPSIETMPERKVHLEISLPICTSSSLFSENRSGYASIATREALVQPADSHEATL